MNSSSQAAAVVLGSSGTPIQTALDWTRISNNTSVQADRGGGGRRRTHTLPLLHLP